MTVAALDCGCCVRPCPHKDPDTFFVWDAANQRWGRPKGAEAMKRPVLSDEPEYDRLWFEGEK